MINTVKVAVVTAAAASLLTVSAHAANPSKNKAEAGTAGATSATLSAADKHFMEDASQTNILEQKLGELAQKKAENADVKSFGEHMVTDHGNAEKSLQEIAQKEKVTLSPDLDAANKKAYDKFESMSPAKFDSAYISEMVNGHAKVHAKMEGETSRLKNKDLKEWNENTVKVVGEHLKMAKDLRKKLASEPGQGKKTVGAKPASKY